MRTPLERGILIAFLESQLEIEEADQRAIKSLANSMSGFSQSLYEREVCLNARISNIQKQIDNLTT